MLRTNIMRLFSGVRSFKEIRPIVVSEIVMQNFF